MKRIVRTVLLLIATLATTLGLALAFSSCSQSGEFIYELNDDGESYSVEFKWWDGYDGKVEELRIPNRYKGKPVTRLQSFSVHPTHHIQKVIIPTSIEYIGKFSSSHGASPFDIEELFFEEGSRCQVIGNYAFANEWKNPPFNKINLPETIKKIGDYAFSGCKETEGLFVPSGVTYIGKGAFENCKRLESVTIPQGFTKIEDDTFSGCTSLTSVVIPDSVTEIGKAAFSGCSLKTLTLPQNLKTIQGSAFSGNDFSEITLPASVTNIGSYAFSYTNLTTITIPAGVESLGKRVFEQSLLKTVTFEDGIQYSSVEEETFFGCTCLENIQLPKDVTTIGVSAFEGCTDLEIIQLPESLKNIGARAFWSCTALRKITFPDSVERVEEKAFEYCESLSSVTFGKNSNGIYFGDKAFYRCRNLKKVYIGNVTAWLQTIFDGSYWNPLENDADKVLLNDSNTELVVPAEVETIPYRAFANCSELERITFEDGSKCKSIGASAFVGCTSLQTVVFDNGGTLTTLGNNAFAGCTALSDFSMPASVKEIKADAFKNCEGLKSVSTESLEAWYAIQFANEDANPLKYAKSLSLGGTPITKLEIPQGVTRIGAYTFINCLTLTEITLPKSVKSVGTGAFNGCTQIAKIHLESLAAWCTMQVDDLSTTPLGTNADLYISGLLLTDVVIPDSVKTLREGAFAGCSSLETVDLGKVTSVGANAFAGCTGLTKVYIPTRVTKIGENAFAGCVNLTIYAQALLAPNGKPHEGWHDNWNPLNRPVEWGQLFMP